MIDLIGFNASIGAGKTTACQFLREKVGHLNVEVVSFAEPMRRALSAMLDIPRAAFMDPKLKESPEVLEEIFGSSELTLRFLMKTLGCEWGRDTIRTDIWLRLFEREVLECREARQLILCDDVRFDDEADLIHQLGGKVIYIGRPQPKLPVRSKNASHISEKGISADRVDSVILNHGTLEEFYDLLRQETREFIPRV